LKKKMPEDQSIEWKESWRDDYLRWICGFANAQGGTLIIGKNDKGQLVGVKDAPKLLEEIPNKVRDILGILVDVNLRREKGHDLIEIVVEPYPYPISYKGEYHYRSGSTKQELKGAALDRFLLRKQGRHWDGVPVPHVSVADLDGRTLAEFRRRALRSQRLSREILQEPDGELLKKLHLTDGAYLKRAAILLFHPDPEKYVTGASVKIGYFRTNADLLYHDQIQGDLFTQADKSLDLLLSKYLKALISYEGLQRVETYPVPEEALREAMLNAIAHKDYGSGTPIQVSVYEDKILIWNPGHLPHDWTVDHLIGKHSSEPYNPDIANAFFRAGMIESWGRGIERIMDACKAAGVPAPKLRHETTGLWIEFPLKKPAVKGKTSEKTSEKTSVKILRLLKETPDLALAELATRVDRTPRAIEMACAKLVREGKLRRIGPDRGGHWEVLG
jgi:ATP-dependent DNA helicase RecG